MNCTVSVAPFLCEGISRLESSSSYCHRFILNQSDQGEAEFHMLIMISQHSMTVLETAYILF